MQISNDSDRWATELPPPAVGVPGPAHRGDPQVPAQPAGARSARGLPAPVVQSNGAPAHRRGRAGRLGPARAPRSRTASASTHRCPPRSRRSSATTAPRGTPSPGSEPVAHAHRSGRDERACRSRCSCRPSFRRHASGVRSCSRASSPRACRSRSPCIAPARAKTEPSADPRQTGEDGSHERRRRSACVDAPRRAGPHDGQPARLARGTVGARFWPTRAAMPSARSPPATPRSDARRPAPPTGRGSATRSNAAAPVPTARRSGGRSKMDAVGKLAARRHPSCSSSTTTSPSWRPRIWTERRLLPIAPAEPSRHGRRARSPEPVEFADYLLGMWVFGRAVGPRHRRPRRRRPRSRPSRRRPGEPAAP